MQAVMEEAGKSLASVRGAFESAQAHRWRHGTTSHRYGVDHVARGPACRPRRSPRITGRNTWPFAIPAGAIHVSIATFTQFGIGVVRMRTCLPIRIGTTFCAISNFPTKPWRPDYSKERLSISRAFAPGPDNVTGC